MLYLVSIIKLSPKPLRVVFVYLDCKSCVGVKPPVAPTLPIGLGLDLLQSKIHSCSLSSYLITSFLFNEDILPLIMLIMMWRGIWDVPEFPIKLMPSPGVGNTGHLHSVSVLLDDPVCVAFNGVPNHLEHFPASFFNDRPSASMMVSKSSEGVVFSE